MPWAVLVAVTMALGMTAPLGSLRVPEILPVVAPQESAAKHRTSPTSPHTRRTFMIIPAASCGPIPFFIYDLASKVIRADPRVRRMLTRVGPRPSLASGHLAVIDRSVTVLTCYFPGTYLLVILDGGIRLRAQNHAPGVHQVGAVAGGVTADGHLVAGLEGVQLPALAHEAVGAGQFHLPIGDLARVVAHIHVQDDMGIGPGYLCHFAVHRYQLVFVVLGLKGMVGQDWHGRQQQSCGSDRKASMDAHGCTSVAMIITKGVPISHG